jgi:hypothetical protein
MAKEARSTASVPAHAAKLFAAPVSVGSGGLIIKLGTPRISIGFRVFVNLIEFRPAICSGEKSDGFPMIFASPILELLDP